MRTRVIGAVREGSSAYIIELNVMHRGGLPAATVAFFDLWRAARDLPAVPDGGTPDGLEAITAKLYQAVLTKDLVDDLLARDRVAAEEKATLLSIFKIWPDYTLHPQIDRSVATVAVDAARR